MAIEIVDLFIKNGDFPWFFGCLPEGSVLLFKSQQYWFYPHKSIFPIASPDVGESH